MKWYQKLKFARRVKGLSLDQVASEILISKSYLCEIERGKVKDPSFFKIVNLLHLYNLTFDDMEET